MEHVIYGLVDPFSGLIRYVGYTKLGAVQRLRDHIEEARCNHTNHRHYWIRSLLRQGQKPTVTVLEKVTKKTWAQRERHWIKVFKSNNLVNSTDGGDGLLNPTPEVREKMREKGKARIFTEETKAKLRASHVGRKYTRGWSHSIETKAKMSAASKGKPKSIEHRTRISEALMGHKVSKHVRRRVSESHLGTNHSPEVRARIRAALLGRKLGETGKEKCRQAAIGRRMILNGGLRRWLLPGQQLPRGWRFANNTASSGLAVGSSA